MSERGWLLAATNKTPASSDTTNSLERKVLSLVIQQVDRTRQTHVHEQCKNHESKLE